MSLPTTSQVSHLLCWVRSPAFLGFLSETHLLSGTLALKPDIHGIEWEIEAEDTTYCNLTQPTQDCPFHKEMPTLVEACPVNCGSASKAIVDFTDDWINTLSFSLYPHIDITSKENEKCTR